jgi:hypothetical protein
MYFVIFTMSASVGVLDCFPSVLRHIAGSYYACILLDAGFKWSLRNRRKFDEVFNDLMAFKAKYGHCDVPRTGEKVSLGKWCSQLRWSYKKIQSNQKPQMKLSNEQIQCLNDAGFKWSLQELVPASIGTIKVVVKVAPAYYVPAEEESLEASWSYASSGVVIRNNALTFAPRPLDSSISATAETTMNVSNEDTNIGSSRRVSAVAAATTMVHKRRNVCKTFDERFKDLMAFKEESGHCNVPYTKSRHDKHHSLGMW